MTYARAKMIIWNPDAYEPSEVRQAAVNARAEDLHQAWNLL